MTPVLLPSGKVGAKLTLKLDRKIGAVPVDSHDRHPPALGARPEVRRARHAAAREEGLRRRRDDARRRRRTVPVELDEVFNMFDAPTRRAAQENLAGLRRRARRPRRRPQPDDPGAPELFGHLGPVMANLADPRTDLPAFFKELDDTARVVAPVSQTNAHLFTTMADTFDAISRDPQALKATIAKSPPTLDAGTASLARPAPVPRAHRGALARPRHRRDRAARRRCRRSTARCASARRSCAAR